MTLSLIKDNEIGFGPDSKKQKIKTSYDSLATLATVEDNDQYVLHPVQDYFDGKMYYGLQSGDQIQRVSINDGIITKQDFSTGTKIQSTNNLFNNYFPSTLISKKVEELYLDPFKLFCSLKEYFQTYIFFTEEIHYDLIALWSMGTYIFKSFPAYPYLHLSGERDSGKSTLMNLLEPICFNGLTLSSMTKPILYRLVDSSLPTLLIDEAELFSRGKSYDDKSGILELLKSGYQANGKSAVMDENKKTPLVHSTYCPKIFASINSIDDILRDRTITIPMMRPGWNEIKNKYNLKSIEVKSIQINLRANLYLFGLTNSAQINNQYEDLPNDKTFMDLVNRDFELWGPLMAISKVIEDYSKGNEITDPLLSFAKVHIADNECRDESENQLIGIALELYRIVCGETHLSLQDNSDSIKIHTELLYQHLKLKVLIDEYYAKGSLSKLLGGRNLASIHNSGGIRSYIIYKAKIKSFVSRYSSREAMHIEYDNNIRL